MGAQTFGTFVERVGEADTLQAAFGRARDDAAYMYGHGGYSGTLAEKDDVILIERVADLATARKRADELIDDERVDDKWGPAGAIETPEGWLFFGWASS